jgi:hypothetical protein
MALFNDTPFAQIPGQTALPVEPTCDICGQAIRAGEPFSNDDGEIAHTACVRGWFARNYGRESL